MDYAEAPHFMKYGNGDCQRNKKEDKIETDIKCFHSTVG